MLKALFDVAVAGYEMKKAVREEAKELAARKKIEKTVVKRDTADDEDNKYKYKGLSTDEIHYRYLHTDGYEKEKYKEMLDERGRRID